MSGAGQSALIVRNLCKSMSSCEDLPEDIVVRILLRLPVKSLIRFTCVSKRWRSVIIYNSNFAKSHQQLASQQTTLRKRVLLTSYITFYGYGGFQKLPPQLHSIEEKCFSVGNFSIPFKNNEKGYQDTRVMASCNGLVLLGQRNSGYDHFTNLSIWNLSTGFFRKLPSSSSLFVMYGFGHVSASDDYKIAVIGKASLHLQEVHVFSLRANIWKVITPPYLSCRGCGSGAGTLSNGALHWVVRPQDPVIYVFDLADEEFRELQLPPVLWQNEEDSCYFGIKILAHFGGSLCLWSWKTYDYRNAEIWVMKEYGHPESWVKLFQLDLYDVPNVSEPYFMVDVCFIADSDTMVLRQNNELFWIECCSKEKPVCSGHWRAKEIQPEVASCWTEFDVTVYDETLVSVAT